MCIVNKKNVPLKIGHWKKLHSKVSQGGARMNIFQ